MRIFDPEIVVENIVVSQRIDGVFSGYTKSYLVQLINNSYSITLRKDVGIFYKHLNTCFLVIESNMRIFCYVVYVIHFAKNKDNEKTVHVEQHVITDPVDADRIYRKIKKDSKSRCCGLF